jgi:enterochelin esterase-like enzyme
MQTQLLPVIVALAIVAVAQVQAPTSFSPAPKGFDIKRDKLERGKVEPLQYDSKTVGEKRRMMVYTPPGYSKDTRYPVLYLLHGAKYDENGWAQDGAAAIILDNLYADGKLVPMLVVMPYGYTNKAGDTRSTAKFEDELLKDVVPTVEARYLVLADREHRALAGQSMGGNQALTNGLKNLDIFAWVGGFSAAIGQGQKLVSDPAAARSKLRLLWISCGDNDSFLKPNAAFHTFLEDQKVPHVWHVDSGQHDFTVWKNDLYLLAQLLFREKNKPIP